MDSTIPMLILDLGKLKKLEFLRRISTDFNYTRTWLWVASSNTGSRFPNQFFTIYFSRHRSREFYYFVRAGLGYSRRDYFVNRSSLSIPMDRQRKVIEKCGQNYLYARNAHAAKAGFRNFCQVNWLFCLFLI